MKQSVTYKHPNGYSAVLYGDSSMSVYHEGKEVLHTGFRNINTEKEVLRMLKDMPKLIEMLSMLTDEDFEDVDI